MPGSWKTSIWKALAEKTWMNLIDFDDDTIEWNMWKKVSKLLEELWEEEFLELEENLALELQLSNSILSTSGSLPLSVKAMEHLKLQWDIIYINIPISTIKTRLERMKVNRIVWKKNMTMDEILEYRHTFYDNSYTHRFNTDWLKSKEIVFDEFWEWFKLQIEKK